MRPLAVPLARRVLKHSAPYLIAAVILVPLAACVALISRAEVRSQRLDEATEDFFRQPERLLRRSAHGTLGLPRDGDDLIEMLGTDKLDASQYESVEGRSPAVDVCLDGGCDASSRRLHFELAYGMQIYSSGSSELWDMVFAPVDRRGLFTRDPIRIVFRIIDGDGRGFGYLVADRQSSARLSAEPPGGMAALVDFWKSGAGEAVAAYATPEKMSLANRVGAPLRMRLPTRPLLDYANAASPAFGSQARDLVEGWVGQELRAHWPTFLVPGTIALAGLVAWMVLLLSTRAERGQRSD